MKKSKCLCVKKRMRNSPCCLCEGLRAWKSNQKCLNPVCVGWLKWKTNKYNQKVSWTDKKSNNNNNKKNEKKEMQGKWRSNWFLARQANWSACKEIVETENESWVKAEEGQTSAFKVVTGSWQRDKQQRKHTHTQLITKKRETTRKEVGRGCKETNQMWLLSMCKEEDGQKNANESGSDRI